MRELTTRQMALLREISTGASNQEIADIEGISVDTIKTRMRTLLRKLGARSRAHAVALAYQQGLLVSKGPEETLRRLMAARESNARMVLKLEELRAAQDKLLLERDRLRKQNHALGSMVPWSEVGTP